MFRYNFFLRSLIQMYLALFFVYSISVQALKEADARSWQREFLKATLSAVLALLSVVPFIMGALLLKSKVNLETPRIKSRYSTLWLGLNTESKAALLFYPLLMLRRAAFVLLITLFDTDSEVQWAGYLYLSVLVQIFSEACILALGMLAISMTEVSAPKKIQDAVGWISICIFSVLIVTNLFVIVGEKAKQFKKRKEEFLTRSKVEDQGNEP